MTARLASGRNQPAGTFTPAGDQSVQCAPVDIQDDFGLDRPDSGCPRISRSNLSNTPFQNDRGGGIVSSTNFGARPGVAPGTWLEIYGTNLATTTREWSGGDFTNNGATGPTSLDCIAVTIGCKNAFIRYAVKK